MLRGSEIKPDRSIVETQSEYDSSKAQLRDTTEKLRNVRKVVSSMEADLQTTSSDKYSNEELYNTIEKLNARIAVLEARQVDALKSQYVASEGVSRNLKQFAAGIYNHYTYLFYIHTYMYHSTLYHTIYI